jgi:hypothetical protein
LLLHAASVNDAIATAQKASLRIFIVCPYPRLMMTGTLHRLTCILTFRAQILTLGNRRLTSGNSHPIFNGFLSLCFLAPRWGRFHLASWWGGDETAKTLFVDRWSS